MRPARGALLNYIDVVRHLDPQQPIYGLQAIGVDGHSALLTSVEAMAASYIEALRAVQPEGPYTIGGWSFGGLVAFEMAQQLRAQGQEIAHLLLIDTVAPPAGRAPDAPPLVIDADEALWMIDLASSIKDVRGLDLELSYSRLKLLDRDGQFDLFRERLHTLDLLPAGTGRSDLEGWRAYFGIGAGWYEEEARGLGLPFPPLRERFERLEETLRIAKHMWSDDCTHFTGRYY